MSPLKFNDHMLDAGQALSICLLAETKIENLDRKAQGTVDLYEVGSDSDGDILFRIHFNFTLHANADNGLWVEPVGETEKLATYFSADMRVASKSFGIFIKDN